MPQPEAQHERNRHASGERPAEPPRSDGMTEGQPTRDPSRSSRILESQPARDPSRISGIRESVATRTLLPPPSAPPDTWRTSEPPLPTQPDHEIPEAQAPDTLRPARGEAPFELELDVDTLPPRLEEERDTIPSPPPPAPEADPS